MLRVPDDVRKTGTLKGAGHVPLEHFEVEGKEYGWGGKVQVTAEYPNKNADHLVRVRVLKEDKVEGWWVGLPKEDALLLARCLIQAASELEETNV